MNKECHLLCQGLNDYIFLQVLFDVVPGIKFQDAIELISMQPIASTAAAWKRCGCIYASISRHYSGTNVSIFGTSHNYHHHLFFFACDS